MSERITIASRDPGFHWAGRAWGTEPVVVVVDNGDGQLETADIHISAAQLAELKRQVAYPLYPLRIGTVDTDVERMAAARDELASVRADIETERAALAELKTERGKVDKALKRARDRLGKVERELQETRDQLEAAEKRAHAAEATQTELEVEALPDPNRKLN